MPLRFSDQVVSPGSPLTVVPTSSRASLNDHPRGTSVDTINLGHKPLNEPPLDISKPTAVNPPAPTIQPIRVACILTHPTQYYSPWFRYLAAHRPEIDLHVLYASTPTAEQQSVGFGGAFEWDVPLLEGYQHTVVRPTKANDNFHSSSFWGVDAHEIGRAIARVQPDVAVVFGWYSATHLRAIWACKKRRIPVLYRGDTTLSSGPVGWKRRLWFAKNRLLVQGGFDGYLSVGKECTRFLTAMGAAPERIFLSPHAIDNDYFARNAAPLQSPDAKRRLRESWGLPGDAFTALFVGKLEAIKRPTDLLEATAKLDGPAACVFVGAGPLETELRGVAQRLGVQAVFLGFRNQSALPECYAAADVLVLPSRSETWGLAVNEALATGLPCIVSDKVGCAADLIVPGETGAVYPMGDPAALAVALADWKQAVSSNSSRAGIDAACRRKAAEYSFAAAADGLFQGAKALTAGRKSQEPGTVVACCGSMAFVGGLERQSFKVLEILRETGRPVHVIGNSWANWKEPHLPHPIWQIADSIGATWSVGPSFLGLNYFKSPREAIQLLWEFAVGSRDLVVQCQNRRANFIFLPDFDYVLRHALGLFWLRLAGIRVVMRVGLAPPRKPLWEFLWGRFCPRLVDRFIANSEFGAHRLQECGIPVPRIGCIKNAVASRPEVGTDEIRIGKLIAEKRTVLCVGQIAPFKGVHLLLEAAQLLWHQAHDFQVVVVGRIPDWPIENVEYYYRLRSLAESCPAGGVHFVGAVENVFHLMRESYVLAAPIVQEETFGNVVLEALASGLPAVVTPRGGLPELVRHQITGYVCRDVSAVGFAEGLAYFLIDSERQRKARLESLASTADPDWAVSLSDLSNGVEAGVPKATTFGTFSDGDNDPLMNPPPILVTGAAGFIGFHFARRLLDAGLSVIGVDSFTDYYDPKLKQDRLRLLESRPSFQFQRLDLSDRSATEKLFDQIGPVQVVHLAAQAGVRYSLANPHAYIECNIVAFQNILEGCRRTNSPHLVYASSSSVYGGNRKTPFVETDSVDHPVSLYAATKRANELQAHTYSHLFGLPTTGLRFFTVYGPWGRPDMALILFTKRILAGEPIDVFNHGKLERDFTYIDDIVESMFRILRTPPVADAGYDAMEPRADNSWAPFRVYNIGNSQPVPLEQLISALEAALGKKAVKNYLPMQPGDVLATHADVSALENATGYRPRVSVEEGVERFVEWYRGYYLE